MHVQVSLELTGIALATIAALALWFAWRQVREMQESTRRQADSARNVELQTRANILLTLDERWETEPMLSVRRELEILISVVEAELARADPQSRDVLRLRRAPVLAARLDQMRREDFEQYFRLCKISGFFETVGYVVRAGYIPLDDVINLLGGSILEAGRFSVHTFKPRKVSPAAIRECMNTFSGFSANWRSMSLLLWFLLNRWSFVDRGFTRR
jgi:hypothetical protein